ncbi:MAG TPA: HAD family phosphatase [Polyangia bacterium]|jgi:HAD superfamily hydrolase (TIGR01549 family)
MSPTAADLWHRAHALIFDFDGVLADSEPVWRDTYNQALAPYGVSVPPEEYWEHWSSKGEGVRGHLRRHGLTGIDPEAVDREQQRRYAACVARGEILLVEGAARLLHLVCARAAARPVVIASNTACELIEQLLAQGGAPVPRIIGGEGLPHKPAPDIFLAALAELEVAAATALVIEDTEKGVRAARAAGVPVLLVRTPFNRRLAIDADHETDGLAALLEWAAQDAAHLTP